MYIADEILKFLVCEVCFENFNQKTRTPSVLFPCGHTFCDDCIGKFRNRTCPACSIQFEAQAKNWSLFNLVPRERMVDEYDTMVDELRQGTATLGRLQKLNADRHELNDELFDAIRARINERAAQLIEKINEGQQILLTSVKQIEDKWTHEMRNETDFERALVNIMNEFNARVDSEEIKTDETKFVQFRALLRTNLDEMSARLEGKSAEEYVNFKVSEVDLETAFDIENLFGELYVNDTGIEQQAAIGEGMSEKEAHIMQSLALLGTNKNESKEKVNLKLR